VWRNVYMPNALPPLTSSLFFLWGLSASSGSFPSARGSSMGDISFAPTGQRPSLAPFILPHTVPHTVLSSIQTLKWIEIILIRGGSHLAETPLVHLFHQVQMAVETATLDQVVGDAP
jgi:hypothetical protein